MIKHAMTIANVAVTYISCLGNMLSHEQKKHIVKGNNCAVRLFDIEHYFGGYLQGQRAIAF